MSTALARLRSSRRYYRNRDHNTRPCHLSVCRSPGRSTLTKFSPPAPSFRFPSFFSTFPSFMPPSPPPSPPPADPSFNFWNCWNACYPAESSSSLFIFLGGGMPVSWCLAFTRVCEEGVEGGWIGEGVGTETGDFGGEGRGAGWGCGAGEVDCACACSDVICILPEFTGMSRTIVNCVVLSRDTVNRVDKTRTDRSWEPGYILIVLNLNFERFASALACQQGHRHSEWRCWRWRMG